MDGFVSVSYSMQVVAKLHLREISPMLRTSGAHYFGFIPMPTNNQDKHDKPVNRPVDKIFAENLGATFAGCVRDLTGSLFNKEVAKAANVSLCPIPFLGTEAKCRFKAFWAAALQAIAIRIAIENLPAYADEKLLKKTLFQMQNFVDQALGRPVFSKMSPEDVERYSTIRSRMTQAALAPGSDKESMARVFLSLVHDIPADSVPDSRINETATHIGISMGLFKRLLEISLNSPNSWTRPK